MKKKLPAAVFLFCIQWVSLNAEIVDRILTPITNRSEGLSVRLLETVVGRNEPRTLGFMLRLTYDSKAAKSRPKSVYVEIWENKEFVVSFLCPEMRHDLLPIELSKQVGIDDLVFYFKGSPRITRNSWISIKHGDENLVVQMSDWLKQ